MENSSLDLDKQGKSGEKNKKLPNLTAFSFDRLNF
jgi:hypothetical protein